MEELISVIIPVYKVEKFLNKCIASVTNQTYKNLEIILIDDGSPDNCPKICDEWAQKDNRIKVIHKKNEGVSKTRNRGIDIACGDYLSFIDSDDYIQDNFFKSLYNKAQNENCDIVLGRYNKIIGDNIEKDTESLENFVKSNDRRLLFCDKGKVNAYLCRGIFKKELFNDLRYDEEIKYLEDLCLFLKMLEKQPQIGYVDEHIYNYVIHKDSLCNKINENYTFNFEQGAIKCLELLRKMGNEIEGRALLFNCYLVSLKHGLLMCDKNLINTYSKRYNTKENFRAFMKCNSTLKSKIKAILARCKLTFAYKILLKLGGCT